MSLAEQLFGMTHEQLVAYFTREQRKQELAGKTERFDALGAIPRGFDGQPILEWIEEER